MRSRRFTRICLHARRCVRGGEADGARRRCAAMEVVVAVAVVGGGKSFSSIIIIFSAFAWIVRALVSMYVYVFAIFHVQLLKR